MKEFAARLKRTVRETDIPAQLAGNEFVALLEGLQAESDAGFIAQKVVAAIREPFLVDGIRLHVTTSIGVAYAALPALDSALLARADEALYQAKGARRNTFKVHALDAFETEYGALELCDQER